MANSRPRAEQRLCVGFFGDEHALVHAVEEAQRRGYPTLDAFSPYPVHGLPRALQLKPSRLPWIGFWAGMAALALGLTLEIWTSAYNWPLRIAGQPLNAWPVFFPVAVALWLLFAGLVGVGALFVRARLWPGKRVRIPRGVTDDRFALALVETDAAVDLEEMMRMLREYRAVEVVEGDELG